MNELENDEELREYSLQIITFMLIKRSTFDTAPSVLQGRHAIECYRREVWGSTSSRILYTYVICCLLFAALYIARPIISFNAFASQLDTPQKSYTLKQVICGIWKQLSPVEVFIVGYGVSGIEAPENMPRCINNCYNLESFWKNWHASFNKWLVRYMYIPLGGSRRKLLNVWVVFTFVAIWHDLEWKLLSWAWLTCIFFILSWAWYRFEPNKIAP
ncbi:putative membrane bound O-acyl transferase, MBOAT [Helianthus annuus]|uniref:Putative membrane bound O-acyl transferase, MBOAT n=1 Tax=Helianthus annuus TaxID=4232 RepID=A0A251SH75_HELAN|nr:putative membrane bound O-acyl transferase, MBOAT [Helianthus annuus]KAJ0485433.1 putative membrane bound O-acyl transferase, MBOAT [Helianthus annuus]KAJ0655984.1 putative membrane bound O-acyl transferase, MBOAT [Helianthus annuus]KAJ0659661.1 putative membrane bound O-acyl transferase, MBOAT [Helianthus annuus]